MRLPIEGSKAKTEALFNVLDGLDVLGLRCVLVGGLVPPLLLEALDPDEFTEDREPRRTADCDLAVDIAVAEGERSHQHIEALLIRLEWQRVRRVNQFRWSHPCKLLLDLLPVPAGIEQGDREAAEFARDKLEVEEQPARFYRGYELALAEAIEVRIESEGTDNRVVRVAGLTSFLAMKLEAWLHSYMDRKRDAYDIAWLLRHACTESVTGALRGGRATRPDLFDEIVERLGRYFTDPWHRGVLAYATELYPHRDDDRTEGDRHAVANAVRRVLEALAEP